MRRSTSSMRGMTLAEMMITVALISIMAALGGTSFKGLLQATREKAEAAEVLDHLGEARSLARSLLLPVTVTVTSTTFTVTPQGRTARVYPVDKLLITLSFNTANGALVFQPGGGTNETEPTVLSIQTRRGQLYRYTIYPAIGAIRRGL